MCVCKEVHIALNSKLTISLFSTESRKNPAGDGILMCKVVHIALNSKLTISLFSTESRKNPAGDGIRTHDLPSHTGAISVL
jgi:hypothetical protein